MVYAKVFGKKSDTFETGEVKRLLTLQNDILTKLAENLNLMFRQNEEILTMLTSNNENHPNMVQT